MNTWSYDYDDLDNWSSKTKYSLISLLISNKEPVWWRISKSGYGMHIRTSNSVVLSNTECRRRRAYIAIKGGFLFSPKGSKWYNLTNTLNELIKFLFVDMNNKDFPNGGIKV